MAAAAGIEDPSGTVLDGQESSLMGHFGQKQSFARGRSRNKALGNGE